MNSKRGISVVVAVVFIILLTIVAIGILWIGVLPILMDRLRFEDFENEFIIEKRGYTVFDWESRTITVQVKRKSDNLDVDGLMFYFLYRGNSLTQYVPISMVAGDSKVFVFEFVDYKDISNVRVAPVKGEKVYGASNIFSDLPEGDLKDVEYDYLIWDDFIKEVYDMDGLVSWWRMDYVNSIYIEDFKGGNHGLIDPDAHSDYAGYWGGALNFDGARKGLNVSDSDSLDIADEITLVAWVNMRANGYYPKIIEKDINYDVIIPGEGRWESYALDMYSNTSSPRFVVSDLANNIVGTRDPTFNASCDCGFNFNEWHFIVGTFDGSLMTLYVDDNIIDTDIAPIGFGPIVNSDDPLYIGEGPANHDDSFDGLLDEVMIFNRSLSRDEVSDLYEHFKKFQGYR